MYIHCMTLNLKLCGELQKESSHRGETDHQEWGRADGVLDGGNLTTVPRPRIAACAGEGGFRGGASAMSVARGSVRDDGCAVVHRGSGAVVASVIISAGALVGGACGVGCTRAVSATRRRRRLARILGRRGLALCASVVIGTRAGVAICSGTALAVCTTRGSCTTGGVRAVVHRGSVAVFVGVTISAGALVAAS
jgi:hypothetical protein